LKDDPYTLNGHKWEHETWYSEGMECAKCGAKTSYATLRGWGIPRADFYECKANG
jgi:hypothetical protein